MSGGAMATFVALKAARDAKAGWDVRRQGIGVGPPLTLYASAEVHAVVERAADMLGLGADALRHVPTDARLRMRIDALRAAIEEDCAAGRKPIAAVGTAGTTSTGAVDPLDAIADVCAEYDLWFHVDGAYGGGAALVTELRPLFRGIERADSIAFDPHKWLYTSQSAGALIVRDLQRLSDSFAVQPTYVHEDKELTRSGLDFFALGPQFSRGFQALKIWVSLLAHGWAAYERRITHDIALARYLHEKARTQPEFEVMAPQSLSIACFRYVPPGLPEAAPEREPYLDRLNERLMAEIQMHGRVFPSNAVLGGRFALRACIVNFRTEAEDIDALLAVAAEIGERLDQKLRPPELRA